MLGKVLLDGKVIPAPPRACAYPLVATLLAVSRICVLQRKPSEHFSFPLRLGSPDQHKRVSTLAALKRNVTSSPLLRSRALLQRSRTLKQCNVLYLIPTGARRCAWVDGRVGPTRQKNPDKLTSIYLDTQFLFDIMNRGVYVRIILNL